MASSWNGKKINRVRVENRLPQFIDRTEQRAARGVAQAMVLIGSETSVLTPIDSSNLINSRYSRVSKDGTRIVGETGYTAEYAAAVNDPDNPQKFRRPTATKDFLVKGAENAEPLIRKVLTGAIKT
jgi:hypothetical protein